MNNIINNINDDFYWYVFTVNWKKPIIKFNLKMLKKFNFKACIIIFHN